MQLLLDTHIWLWSLREPQLTSVVQQALADPANQKFLSAIQHLGSDDPGGKKRIVIHDDFTKWFLRTADGLGLSEVGLGWKVVGEMRYILPNHRDPSDRFLAATAIAHDMVLVTADQKTDGSSGPESARQSLIPFHYFRYFWKNAVARCEASAVASGR
jgi:PIN domain nuclease of toxin-antitoxin system